VISSWLREMYIPYHTCRENKASGKFTGSALAIAATTFFVFQEIYGRVLCLCHRIFNSHYPDSIFLFPGNIWKIIVSSYGRIDGFF